MGWDRLDSHSPLVAIVEDHRRAGYGYARGLWVESQQYHNRSKATVWADTGNGYDVYDVRRAKAQYRGHVRSIGQSPEK